MIGLEINNVICNARLAVAHDSNDDSIRKGTHAIIKRYRMEFQKQAHDTSTQESNYSKHGQMPTLMRKG